MIISLKKTKIIILITCIIAVGLVITFPYFHKYKTGLERTSYCDGFAIQTKQMNPEADQKEVYNKCVKDYVKS